MNKLSVLTPTYNRSQNLKTCYASLLLQSNKNFEWIIIDDGSTDDTKQVINEIIKDDKIDVKYIYKKNGGKHTAINQGVKIANSSLTLILDSDDYLSWNAIEKIFECYTKYSESPNICGFTFLKKDGNGQLMGRGFPEEGIYNFIELRINGKYQGEYCDVFFTKYLREYPFSEYEGENFIGESTVWIKISQKYDMVYVNEIIYNAEYLDGGLTKKGRQMRISCPKGGMEYAKTRMLTKCSFRVRMKSGILYNCYGTFLGMNLGSLLKKNEYIILTMFTYPFGVVLYKYWKSRYLLKEVNI